MSSTLTTKRALTALTATLRPTQPARAYICWRCQMSTSVTRTSHTPLPQRDTRKNHLATKPRTWRRTLATTPQRRGTKEDTSAPSSTLPSNPQTHYDYFPTTLPSGAPPTGAFTLDLRALRREFLQLQAQAHPDRHPPELKHKAEALSSRINDAYKTLQDPLRRAVYILSLNGIDVEAEAERAGSLGMGSGEVVGGTDQELLMVVLEARELIEEAQEEQELEGLKAENEERIAESVGVLEEAMAAGEWERCKSECSRLRYWMNIRQSIEEWEPGKPVMLQH